MIEEANFTNDYFDIESFDAYNIEYLEEQFHIVLSEILSDNYDGINDLNFYN